MFGRDLEAEKALEQKKWHRKKELNKLNSPAGIARVRRAAGDKVFQISLPLSTTSAMVVPMDGAYTVEDKSQHNTLINSIEAEGWILEHAGYVYKMTRTTSRDKFMSSGQQEAIEGELVGIYIFRVKPESESTDSAV